MKYTHMDKMIQCTCGCKEHTTTVVAFVSGWSPETADVDYADVDVCASCGKEAHVISCIDDDDDDLPF